MGNPWKFFKKIGKNQHKRLFLPHFAAISFFQKFSLETDTSIEGQQIVIQDSPMMRFLI